MDSDHGSTNNPSGASSAETPENPSASGRSTILAGSEVFTSLDNENNKPEHENTHTEQDLLCGAESCLHGQSRVRKRPISINIYLVGLADFVSHCREWVSSRKSEKGT